MTDKAGCSECSWRGLWIDTLKAKNPFDLGMEVIGCPYCKEAMSIRTVCDEQGCEEFATYGTPIKDGYMQTCGKHLPK